jgi:hypothetical protein
VKTILVQPSIPQESHHRSKKGDVRIIELHGCSWPAELRAKPPRVRLLEDARGPFEATLCEILDPWPGAPEYWPPEWQPGAPHNPFSIYACSPAQHNSRPALNRFVPGKR